MTPARQAAFVAQSLARVEQAARHAAAARVDLEDELRNARANGATLRELAKAAGLSVENVRRITTKKPIDMTTDEAMRAVFPKEVVAHAKKLAKENS